MANAQQLKSLLRSHTSRDDERFYAVVLQVAASEARKGHQKLANELRALIETARKEKSQERAKENIVGLSTPYGEVSELLDVVSHPTKVSDLILEDSLSERINRILTEQKNLSRLKENSLRPRQRLLFTGPPGCGKTLTASALANELGLPLFVVRLDSLLSRYLGESLSKLRLIFDAVEQNRAVYLFDEFDSIGFTRDVAGEIGEMRRVLNSFLVFIEGLQSNSLVIAATNHGHRLDKALFRRFDDLVEFGLPESIQVRELIKRLLKDFSKERLQWKPIEEASQALSYAEITKAVEETLKDMLINEKEKVTNQALISALTERRLHLNH